MRYILSLLFVFFISVLSACSNAKDDVIRVGVSADYPPFEYKEGDIFKGFDIELAQQIVRRLGKKIEFVDSSFTTLLPMLNAGHIDMAISCIAATKERRQNFDFSQPYYFDTVVMLVNRNSPYTTLDAIKGKRIGVQLGSTMQLWAESHNITKNLTIIDNTLSLVEALKVGHLDGVLMDKMQAYSFMTKNAHFTQFTVEKPEEGYAIVFKKGSPYTAEVNALIKQFEEQGILLDLEKKWLVHAE